MSSQYSGRRIDPLLIEEEGHAESLIGNEAIVRGALEAGVSFASGYPGTPSSEVTDSFSRIAKMRGIIFEYSVNEKVALEMAFAASLAGARSICAMKHLGLMYAGDPLSTIPYVGTVGGMVIVSAGDPSCYTSPNEQDQRHLAPMLQIPMLDPVSPRQAYEMARFAFDLSEQSRLPVVLRPTARVCHSRGVIRYGLLKRTRVPGFLRDPERFNPIPINARKLRLELFNRVQTARTLLEKSDFVQRSGKGRLGICAMGAPAATCTDLLRELGLEDIVSLFSLGVAFPLPDDALASFLGDVDKVLVLEELSPYLEDALSALCARKKITTEILGKRTGHLPVPFEYQPSHIRKAMFEGLGLGSAPSVQPKAPDVPSR
ncbi:MAG: indolepyruvate ferredoxin oxidoreductase subunit alpha, partial [Pseudomonadota bacterium]